MCSIAIVSVPFPLDFDVEDDACMVCKGELNANWICTRCHADHFEGVMLLIGYGSPKRGVPASKSSGKVSAERHTAN